MQKCICLGLKHTTIRLEHCGRKASLITLDILFQWLGVESNYTNSSEEKIFWRWTTLNFNIGICVQGLVSGMWGFFFPPFKTFSTTMKYASSISVYWLGFQELLVHKIMQTVTGLHTLPLPSFVSFQLDWCAWPSFVGHSFSHTLQRNENFIQKLPKLNS